MDGINVLSLFDGMSCGRIALERAGIKVKNYYASEIDKYAIKVSQENYPENIQLGDITEVRAENLPKIDLIIGGSPCQGFSFAGKQLNFKDSRSKLFFEYVRLVNECRPKHFMLENVKMKKEYQDIISRYLKCEPVEINSALVSAQNRKRLYWTNLEVRNVPSLDRTIQTDLGYKEVVDGIYNSRPKRVYTSKSPTIRAGRQGLKSEDGQKLTVNDYEILQTVPVNYTKSVSNAQRYKMLGNGWTVDVIVYIFKGLI